MADRGMAPELLDDGLFVEAVGDVAHLFMGVETLAVEGDDAGGFLAAMLKGVKAENGVGRGFFDAVNAYNAALFFEMVVVEGVRCQHFPGRRPLLLLQKLFPL
jgi:hypothetical protein